MLAPDEIMVDLSCLCGSFPGSFFYDRLAACRRQRLDHPSVAAAAKWSPPCRLLCVCVQQAKSPLAKRHAPRNSTRRYSRISSNGDETEIDGLVITVFQVQHSCVTTDEGVATVGRLIRARNPHDPAVTSSKLDQENEPFVPHNSTCS
jgi:hypothetical protein